MYTPLHVYTGSSFFKSGLRIEDYVSNAAKAGFSYLAISDFETLRGAPKFVHLCEKENIKPIIGVDFVIDGLLISFFVKNEDGFRNLLKLFYKYQKGEISLKNYSEFTNGLIVVISIVNARFKEEFSNNNFNYWLVDVQRGVEDFYLGIAVDPSEYFYHGKVREFAVKHTYKTVAFPSVKYLKPSDAITLEMVTAIRDKEKITITSLEGNEYLLSDDELPKYYEQEDIDETNVIANKIDFKLVTKRGKLIEFKNDLGMTSDEYLHERVKNALKERGMLRKPVYVERAKRELDVIQKMGYSDYFLLVADYVNWAKDRGILVGPGRGSGPGSLIAYVLGITIADPIKYNLLFERFLNIERQTMPDIDVDFPDVDRDSVFEYLRSKYGSDHVANILAVQNIGAKQSLRDVGSIYGYDQAQIDLVCKTVDGDISLRENYKQNPKFKELVKSDKYYLDFVAAASKIEGLPRQSSLHAAGVVLNADPLQDVIPVTVDSTGRLVEEFEKDYLEEQQFLKMDVLGITNLTIIQNCLNRIKRSTGNEIKYKDIPWEDEEAIKLIASGKTMGLFQLESEGMRNSIKVLKPSKFEDIVALLALYRPGPMANIPTYAKRKAGKEAIPYISNALKEILEPTYGIIVYQEQIMQIANKMAGFSLGQADLFRRAISKKKVEQLLALKDSFIKGCIENGYSEKEADTVYEYIFKFADYGFNRSHSLVYAIVTCQMAYLKRYYPADFYASILDYNSGSSSNTFNLIMSEVKSLGIAISVPDINESTGRYRIVDGKLIFPLTAVKQVSTNVVRDILIERKENGKYKDLLDFATRTYKYRVDRKIINSLINAGAFDSFGQTRATLRSGIQGTIQYAEEINSLDNGLFPDTSFIPRPRFIQTETDLFTDLNLEYEALGMMLSGSPLSLQKDKTKNINVTNITELDNVYGDVNLVAVIKNIKTIRNKKGEQMAFLTIYDDSGEMEITVFSDIYEKSMSFLKKNEVIVVTGFYNNRKDKFNLSISAICKLEDY